MHPSLSTSIPPVNSDISNTLIAGRSAVIYVAKSTPVISPFADLTEADESRSGIPSLDGGLLAVIGDQIVVVIG